MPASDFYALLVITIMLTFFRAPELVEPGDCAERSLCPHLLPYQGLGGEPGGEPGQELLHPGPSGSSGH